MSFIYFIILFGISSSGCSLAYAFITAKSALFKVSFSALCSISP
ncbi:truncated hypothetical protein [Staphylococcus aureus]|nr:truncated hypothetical protein [Staphylococcus aureus]